MGFFSSDKYLKEGERRQKLNAFNVLVLCMLAPASLTYGYSASIIATTLGQPSFLVYFSLVTAEGELTSSASSIFGATGGLFFAGATLGPLFLPWLADKYGRKWSIVFTLVLSLIGFAVQAGSTHIAEFLAFRFVSGWGAFALLAAVPVSTLEAAISTTIDIPPSCS